MSSEAHLQYLLRLADNALILGQRNAEWTGHGPVLEEDIALSNLSLDLIGQARLLYTHAGRIEGALTGTPRNEDDYAYWRAESAFRNYTLLELPHAGPMVATSAAARDYAVTIVRHFLYAAVMVPMWEALTASADTDLAAIAAKSLKEMRYHLAHTRDWLVRFGDGTEASHARAQAALDWLMPYTNEFFATDAVEEAVAKAGIGVRLADLREAWETIVRDALDEATLAWPESGPFVSNGKHGVHSEHMGYLLAEMQGLARQFPGASW